MGQLVAFSFMIMIIVRLCLSYGVQGDNIIVLYVTPSVHEICPETPCLTLQQFATENASIVESNTTLIFLPGNHGLDANISLSDVDYLAMFSESFLADNESLFNITCQPNSGFDFINIDHLWIKGISFIGCSHKASLIELFTVENCIFEGRSYSGTAMEIDRTIAKISDSSFLANIADYCNCVFTNEFGDLCVSAAGALLIAQSNASITSCEFQDNSAEIGGALYIRSSSNVTITGSTFISNEATDADVNSTCACTCSEAGVEISNYGYSVVADNTINVCSGGGIALFNSTLTIDNSIFNNSKSECAKGGSALSVNDHSTAAIHNSEFWNNNARIGFGGALRVGLRSNVMVYNSTFSNNTGYQGAAMSITSYSSVVINGSIYCSNVANLSGGAIATDQSSDLTDYYSQFISNRAATGGALSIVRSTMLMRGTVLQKNEAQESGGAIYILQSVVTCRGFCNVSNNSAHDGGAIYAAVSTLNIFLSGKAFILHNLANNTGGGIYLYHSDLIGHYSSITKIANNRATTSGGGIHAINSLITMYYDREFTKSMDGSMHFIENTAKKGGGVCLESNSQIHVQKTGNFYHKKELNVSIYFVSNVAEFGGAIYVVDETYFDVCSRELTNPQSSTATCFIQVLSQTLTPSVHEYNSTTRLSIMFISENCSGSIIVGGLLDRCIPDSHYAETVLSAGTNNYKINGWTYLKLISNINDTNCISSSPVRLCFCPFDDISNIVNCTFEHPTIEVMKGERFNISLVAVDQVNHTVKFVTIYTSLRNRSSGLGTGQSIQMTKNACTPLNFTVFSQNSSDQLIMYPEGPCRNESMSQRRVLVTFKPCTCPIGFQPVNNPINDNDNCECECNSKLNPFFTGSKCDTRTGTLIREGTPWVNFVNDSNMSGYIVYPHCPFDYCLPPYPSVEINLNDVNGADAQCANKRSGILCSVCDIQQNLSLSLGNSHCIHCSESWYLAIVIGTLLAGVVLVALLMLMNLTVAVGTLNGLIFYANIIGAGGHAFFTESSSATKFLAILTSWINLDIDIGFDICFINGLDTYWKTWLRFGFPLYVIFLIVMIIVISKHSMRFSRLISRRNPVATLATLILLSYTMFLRNTISILSIAYIEYPDSSKRRMWLPDATVEYLRGKHIVLFIVAVLILILSLPYTFMLFFWQWRLPYQDEAIFKWIKSRRLVHFIEPYHAPYLPEHRYWTGLLLFTRIALYLIFALNASSDPGVNLLAIVISIAGILSLKGLYGKIYKKSAVDKIEMLCYLNLGTFSAARLYLLEGDNQKAVDASTYISGAITLGLLFGIILYHLFSESCCKGLKKCRKQGIQGIPLDASTSDKAETTVAVAGQSLVKATCSVIEAPKGNDEEIQFNRFSEQSHLLHRTKTDSTLSKRYGSTP